MSQPVEDANEKRIRSVRVSPAELSSVLDELDRADEAIGSAAAERRSRYRIVSLHVDVQQPGATNVTRYALPTRWLTATRLAYLHGGFLHAGTLCRTKLVSLFGTWQDVDGCVERCRHVAGPIHEVTVRFWRKIDLSLFCQEAMPLRVLLVEDDALTARMLVAWLRGMNSTVEHVSDGQAAVNSASAQRFDVILMDLELPIMDGLAATRALRERGYSGAIVAISSLTTPQVQRATRDVGCDQFLGKPFGRDALAAILASCRVEPVVSSLRDDASLAPLIAGFVDQLPQQLAALQQALADEDGKSLSEIARHLRAQGGTYGFESLVRAASAVEQALAAGALTDEARDKALQVIDTCARVRSPTGSSEVTPRPPA